MRTFPRLQMSIVALLLVLIPAYFAVVHGDTIDLSAFVYAVPICAIAFIVLVVAFRFASPQGQLAFGLQPAHAAQVGRAVAHPTVHLVFCVVGLAIVGGFFLNADAESRAYSADPTCTLLLTYEPTDAGACRVQAGHIVDTRTTRGRSLTYHWLRLAFSGGESRWVKLAGSYPYAIWQDAQSGALHEAVVQWYHGRIVAISTTSGRASTDAMPSIRTKGLFITSLVLAVSGIFTAVRILLTKSA